MKLSYFRWDKAQDMVLDNKMKEAFTFILSIIDNLKNYDMPDVEYNIPRLVLLALVKRAQEHKAKAEQILFQEACPEDFEDSKR